MVKDVKDHGVKEKSSNCVLTYYYTYIAQS